MAGKRSVPTDLFWDEAFSGLCGETQSIFIGLLLGADDHGRGPAGEAVLARMLAKDITVIQAALQTLHENGFIQCYQVEGKSYYYLPRWDEWETLNKPARSRYPAPPATPTSASTTEGNVSEQAPEIPGNSQAFLENPAIPRKILSEAEAEEKRKEAEGDASPDTCVVCTATVIPFPTRDGGGHVQDKETLVHELAQILHVPVTVELKRLLAEFQTMPREALLGEANAARAWVDQPHGKRHKQTPMTLPFFRRWVQRSQRIASETVATGTEGAYSATGPARLPNLMHLDDDLPTRKGGRL